MNHFGKLSKHIYIYIYHMGPSGEFGFEVLCVNLLEGTRLIPPHRQKEHAQSLARESTSLGSWIVV